MGTNSGPKSHAGCIVGEIQELQVFNRKSLEDFRMYGVKLNYVFVFEFRRHDIVSERASNDEIWTVGMKTIATIAQLKTPKSDWIVLCIL